MKKALALVGFLLLAALAQETLTLTAPVGRTVTLATITKTQMQLLDFYWPESLPRPMTNPSLFSQTNRGTVTYRVVAPGVVEITYRGKVASLQTPLEIRYRVRYWGASMEIENIDQVLEELTQKLKLPKNLKGQLRDMLSGLPGFGQASVVPEYTVPLVPGASRTIATPYLGGRSAETEVTYLGLKDGVHRFKLRTHLHYVELDWLQKLLPPGSVSLVALGPGWTESESAFTPDGLPADSHAETETLSFTFISDGKGALLLAAKVRIETENRRVR